MSLIRERDARVVYKTYISIAPKSFLKSKPARLQSRAKGSRVMNVVLFSTHITQHNNTSYRSKKRWFRSVSCCQWYRRPDFSSPVMFSYVSALSSFTILKTTRGKHIVLLSIHEKSKR